MESNSTRPQHNLKGPMCHMTDTLARIFSALSLLICFRGFSFSGAATSVQIERSQAVLKGDLTSLCSCPGHESVSLFIFLLFFSWHHTDHTRMI